MISGHARLLQAGASASGPSFLASRPHLGCPRHSLPLPPSERPSTSVPTSSTAPAPTLSAAPSLIAFRPCTSPARVQDRTQLFSSASPAVSPGPRALATPPTPFLTANVLVLRHGERTSGRAQTRRPALAHPSAALPKGSIFAGEGSSTRRCVRHLRFAFVHRLPHARIGGLLSKV